jgi:hypothetical protein
VKASQPYLKFLAASNFSEWETGCLPQRRKDAKFAEKQYLFFCALGALAGEIFLN